MIITSRENKIFKLISKLHTKKGRDELGMFIAEGKRCVSDAYSKGAEILYLILCEGYCADGIDCKNTYILAPELFSELSGTVTPQGIIGVFSIPKLKPESINIRRGGCIVLCEALQDPGNIGTIIRTAHASDCDGVILSKGCCDLFNPKIVRATVSAIFSVPVITGADTLEIINHFRAKGYKIAAGIPGDDTVSLFDTDISEKLLLIIGNEGNGVSMDTVKECDLRLKIPMRPDSESLNASVAASVIMYEHLRQKNYR